MRFLQAEIEHHILSRIKESFLSNTSRCRTCELVNLTLVCEAFKLQFYPILQEINSDPVGWSIQNEHRRLFEYWFEVAKVWADGCREPRGRYIEKFLCGSNLDFRNKHDEFSSLVFSLAGKHDVTSEFLKFLWITLHENGFPRFSMKDYFDALGVEPTKDIDAMREELLKDNSSLNVLYHIERNYMCVAGSMGPSP